MDDPHAEVEIKSQLKPRGSVATQSQNLITQLIKNHPSMSTEAFPSALVIFLNCPADFRVTRGQETLDCNQRSKICPGTLRMRG